MVGTAKKYRLLGALLASAAMIAACDQREERVDRATSLYDAVREQVAEEALGQDISRSPLERASIDERSIGGAQLLEVSTEAVSDEESPRFAVGSIIAKPAALGVIEAIEAEEPMEMTAIPLAMEERSGASDEVIGGPRTAQIERSLPVIEVPQAASREIGRKIDRRPNAALKLEKLELPDLGALEGPQFEELEALKVEPRVARPLETIGGPRGIARAPALPSAPRQVLKIERRMAISAPKVQVQEAARSKMISTMEKYGLEGRVDPLDRGGQMKLNLRSRVDPTRFQEGGSPDGETSPQFALEQGAGCPDDVPYEEIRENPVLATICVVEELEETGEFEYVEKDYIFEHQFVRREKKENVIGVPVGVDGILTPNDPLFGLQWHYASYGDGEGQSLGGAGFVDFWSREAVLGSQDIVVAIVDTGLDLDHPDIIRSSNVKQGYDFVSDPLVANDGDGRDADPDDPGDLCDPRRGDEDTFHGTHVAGIIGAAITNNGAGIAGGAWNVSIVPVRAMGRCGGQLSDINDAIRWSAGLIPAITDDDQEIWNDNPADIINLSLGLNQSCPPSLQDAIDSVVERGVIVVSAAGNARKPTSFYAPGGCRNVLSVAAGDARGQMAPYSNYGVEVDILAPGGDLSRDDNGDKLPDGVLSTKTAKNCIDPVTGNTEANCNYAFEQGTSMAAPHVSAALALIMAKYPDASPEQVRALLLEATEPRTAEQCSGSCLLYPGATRIPGSDTLCARPCGGRLLNLANLPTE